MTDNLGLIIATVLFVVALAIIFLVQRRRAARRQTVLIVGLSDAGKSLIFTRLIGGKLVRTVTSMQENATKTEIEGRQVELVDVPGAVNVRHARLQHWLHENQGALKGIIYVIDSCTFQRQARDVAELLYDLLIGVPNGVPLVVTCNKQDQPVAKSAQTIETALEKELTVLCSTRQAALESTSGDGDTNKSRRRLAEPGEQFSWDSFDQVEIDFIECNAIAAEEEDEEEYDLSGIEQWLMEL